MREKFSIESALRSALLIAGVMGAQPAHASEFGCKILLCLAAPASIGGPGGVKECVQDLRKLFRDLAKGRPFPTCDFGDGGDGRSSAQVVYDYFDPCPGGTEPAPRGVLIAQGTPSTSQSYSSWGAMYGSYDIVGQPAYSQREETDRGVPLSARACVGPLVGTYLVRQGDYDDTINVYSSIVWQEPQSPMAIDVYRDNQFWQRVRF